MNWDLAYRGEDRELDDAARGDAGGAFVRLPEGCTHYEMSGPQEREPVVLVHGFSVPYFIWDGTFQALTAAGLRVLRYDLFGRGYSDRPHARYSLDFFVGQLQALLDALRLGRVSLVSLSMGGAIASAFTVRFPERVRRLALIDPIGAEPMPLNWLYRTALLPGVSELLLSLFGTDRMVESLARDFFDPAEVRRFREQYRAQMRLRGFRRAILSTLRNRAVSGCPAIYDALGALPQPVMLIWGRHDRTLPLRHSEGILQRVPRARLHVIEDSGHIPNVEQPGVVHALLIQFLGQDDQ